MYKMFREHGIVSVFLVIVLVPCIVFSSLFVDISRVMLGKGAAASAADLALNSLMSNYDALLAEMYGLMGSCQNINEFYAETAEYFSNALQSRGLSTEDADSLLTYIKATFNNTETSDLLAMEVVGNTGDIISPVKNTALDNAVIIEDQIVEFMKYRGPIEITQGIIDRLSKSGAAKAFGEANENEQLVEEKEEFAESADDLTRQLYYCDKRIDSYLDLKPSLYELKTMANNLTKYRELYREANEKIVSNLHQTSDLSVFSRYTISLTYYNNYYKLGSNAFKNKNNKLYSTKTTADDGTVTYSINQTDMQRRLTDLENKISSFKTAKRAVVDNVGTTLINANLGSGSNQYNEIQWWKAVSPKVNAKYSDYQTKARNMLTSYSKLLAAASCEIEEEYKTLWNSTDKSRYESLISQVRNLRNSYLAAGKTNSKDSYLVLVNKLESVSANNIGKISSSNVKLSNGKTIGSTVQEISTNLSQYKTDLNEMIEAIDVIVHGDSWFVNDDKSILPKYHGLDNLSGYVETYNTELKDWKSTAENTDSDMATKDLEEINTHKETYEKVTKQSVTALKNRFLNIRSLMQGIVDAIDKLSYGGENLTKITGYSDMYENVSGKIGNVPLTNGEIKSLAESIFSSNFVPYSSDKTKAVYTIANVNDPNYNPDLTVSKPSLYAFIEKEFAKADTQTQEKHESKADEIDEQDENNDPEAKEKDAGSGRTSGVSKTNITSFSAAEFPSGFAANEFKLGSSFIQNISTLIDSLVNGNISTIRDNVYLAEYCMDMFSYATYVNEGKRALYQEKNPKTDLSYKNRASTYLSSSITGSANTAGTWLSSDIKDTYNQSLTNIKINSTNNVAHGAEVEYVLYGLTNEKSVKAAYTDIFGIRYSLNLISSFCYFWSNSVIVGTANTLSAASGGIVPAVFIKVVLLALLTLLETDHDLDVLQAGLSVPVFKVKEDWVYSLKNGSMGANDPKLDAGVNKPGLYYSDYIYIFLLLGFGSGTKSQMCKRIADVVQANMRVANKISNYSLKKSFVYFQINTSVKVKPLMLDLSYVDSYSNNPKNDDSLFTIKVKEVRGYS